MSTAKQFEFIRKQLELSAENVGIDLARSEFGLVEIYNRLGKFEQILDHEDHVEADRLMDAYGATESGVELLYSLGEACFFADGSTWMNRTWEEEYKVDGSFADQGWASVEERSLCDFALYAGFAIRKCNEYLAPNESGSPKRVFSELGKRGAIIRHTPMRELAAWAVDQNKKGAWKSANQAAHALKDAVIAHGLTINASLSQENAQRTIAEWIRAAEKKPSSR